MSNIFWYEHMGHMQISVLTLELYGAIFELTKDKINIPVKVRDIIDLMERKGFPRKVILSEIERFFYGFECIESYIDDTRYLYLTQLGIDYMSEIMKEILKQDSEIAFIVKDSRKKANVNVIVQESTFFDNKIYQLLQKYRFRDGGTRDFLKCLPINELKGFIGEVMCSLNKEKKENKATLKECIDLVKGNGKYWSSVASKYAWIFFRQKYKVNLTKSEWKQYSEILNYAKRPVEWGGNAKDVPENFMEENSIEISNFLNLGIIRKLYDDGKFLNKYRLTAPGYLMHERKERGFLFECILRKNIDGKFTIYICEASDRDAHYLYGNSNEYFLNIYNANYNDMLNFIERQFLLYKNRGAFYE